VLLNFEMTRGFHPNMTDSDGERSEKG